MDRIGLGNEEGENDMFVQLVCFPGKFKQCMDAMVSSYIPDRDIRLPHLMVVSVIDRMGSASQKEIRKHLPFDKSYISTLVRDLMEKGLVVNESDGKAHSLMLTDSGKVASSVSRMVRDIIDANLFKDFTEEETETFKVCMSKLENRAWILRQTYDSKE